MYKDKEKVLDKGKKLYVYLVSWIIRSETNSDKEELFFMFKHISRIENKYKILIQSLIVSLLLLEKDCIVKLEIEFYIWKMISQFFGESE